MGDHIFEYLMVLLFGLMGIRILIYGITGFLLYHKKVQAEAKSGERYVRHSNKYLANRARADMSVPKGGIGVKSAVFTYEENGKKIMATAVNLLGDDNTYIDSGKLYTIKVSPFNPHKCYFLAIQLYIGCSIPAKIFIFVMRTLPRAGGLMFIGVAWFIYTSFIAR